MQTMCRGNSRGRSGKRNERFNGPPIPSISSPHKARTCDTAPVIWLLLRTVPSTCSKEEAAWLNHTQAAARRQMPVPA